MFHRIVVVMRACTCIVRATCEYVACTITTMIRWTSIRGKKTLSFCVLLTVWTCTHLNFYSLCYDFIDKDIHANLFFIKDHRDVHLMSNSGVTCPASAGSSFAADPQDFATDRASIGCSSPTIALMSSKVGVRATANCFFVLNRRSFRDRSFWRT